MEWYATEITATFDFRVLWLEPFYVKWFHRISWKGVLARDHVGVFKIVSTLLL